MLRLLSNYKSAVSDFDEKFFYTFNLEPQNLFCSKFCIVLASDYDEQDKRNAAGHIKILLVQMPSQRIFSLFLV